MSWSMILLIFVIVIIIIAVYLMGYLGGTPGLFLKIKNKEALTCEELKTILEFKIGHTRRNPNPSYTQLLYIYNMFFVIGLTRGEYNEYIHNHPSARKCKVLLTQGADISTEEFDEIDEYVKLIIENEENFTSEIAIEFNKNPQIFGGLMSTYDISRPEFIRYQVYARTMEDFPDMNILNLKAMIDILEMIQNGETVECEDVQAALSPFDITTINDFQNENPKVSILGSLFELLGFNSNEDRQNALSILQGCI